MSAPLSNQQMAMFLTPKEIQSRGVDPGEYEDADTSAHDLWARKYHEAHDWDHHGFKQPYDLATDVAIHGVKSPVTLSKESGRLTDGYHRVAAAAMYRPKDLIPVEYE